MLKIAISQDKVVPLNQIIILGDFADCYRVSLHPKLPKHLQMTPRKLTDELTEVHYHLTQLRELFPQAEIIYIEGNHEARLTKYIVTKCEDLAGLVKTLPEYFHLDSLKIKWIPYERHQLIRVLDTDLFARHEPYCGGKHTALGSIDKGKISLLHGHTHRKQTGTLTDALGNEITCSSAGWLGNPKAEIFEFMKKDDWSHGFQFIYSHKKQFYIEVVPIIQGKSVRNASLF